MTAKEELKLSEKEMQKIGAYQGRLNAIRGEFEREQAAFADLVDLIGDRHGVALVGPEATHQIGPGGTLVEAPRNADDTGSKQLLTEDK